MLYTENQFKRYTVTSALPYANGPVHIGHLAGVYIPADIYARYLRLAGEDVIYIGGSDEHGVPITIKARNEGITPQEVVDHYHAIIKKSFEDFGISFDIYSRTSDPIHHRTASDFFLKLYQDNKFIEKTTQQYYDEEARQFLADRYITGVCPHCSNERAYGDQCESCGTSLSPTDLLHPKSVLSGSEPVLKDTKHWFLPLNEYEDFLKEWILIQHKQDWRSTVYGQCKSWIDMGLQPRAVTRDLDWGIKLPVPDTDGKVLYVWFDAPIGYISATKIWADQHQKDWQPYWKDTETKLVHFIGKDNIVFHCIIFPVMLKAEGSYILPENVPANEFMNLENDKISTSRNWAVWLHEYMEDFPDKQDVLRYVLTSSAPETKDNDFTWKDFQAKNNNELVAIFGNFVNRTLVLTHKYYQGRIPAKDVLNETDRAVMEQIKTYPELIGRNIEKYHFRDGLSELMNLARLGNKYLTDNEPWKEINTNPQHVTSVLNIALQIAANLSILCEPFLPFTAKKLQTMLNMQPAKWSKAGCVSLLDEGALIGEPTLLFEKTEDSAIEEQLLKLRKAKEQNAQNAQQDVEVEPQKALISYEDFMKADLRICQVLEAERVAKTKKLLKLKVDTGFDIRTIISGIAENYEPEALTGKKVLMLVNLQPKEIIGTVSQGMILMADCNGTLGILTSDKDMPNGSIVK
ncbi:MAG: methionine--tRNA ligase [Bacteroidales bacterium]|jgi:methionyl-tRNA synthetase|nr:methionine--tRNA ligase [Bacteroidales bacterium]